MPRKQMGAQHTAMALAMAMAPIRWEPTNSYHANYQVLNRACSTTLRLNPRSPVRQVAAASAAKPRQAGLELEQPLDTGYEAPNSPSDDGSPSEVDVVIVGAGLAGLAAARHLHKQCRANESAQFQLLEASDDVGGRVRTDVFQGYVLDRGFQIFISAYPEAARILDYGELELQSFYAGALVWFGGRFHRVADPFRHVLDGILSLGSPIGTVFDKILVGIVRLKTAFQPFEDILSAEELEIGTRLAREGFSSAMVDRFFRPFFGGIFFDRELKTTSRLFDFVFKCLALGQNTLPAKGIGEISQQLARSLPEGSISLNSKVKEILVADDGKFSGVELESGRIIRAKQGIILAVEGPEAARLLSNKASLQITDKSPRSTVCLYFSADSVPIDEPILLLNGSGRGNINNMFFPSSVSSSYAPPGKALISVSLIGFFSNNSDAELEEIVRSELSEWFGSSLVAKWQHLKTYRILFAQPDQTPPTNLRKEPKVGSGLYLCGDHRDSATFDGALVSGRRAAQSLLSDSRLQTKRVV